MCIYSQTLKFIIIEKNKTFSLDSNAGYYGKIKTKQLELVAITSIPRVMKNYQNAYRRQCS